MGAHGKVLSPQHSLFPLPLITSLLCHYCSLSAQAYNPDIYNFLDSPLALPAFRTIGGKHIHKNSSAKAQNRHNHVPWFAPRIASLQSLGGVHKYNKALCPWPLIITHLPFSPNLLWPTFDCDCDVLGRSWLTGGAVLHAVLPSSSSSPFPCLLPPSPSPPSPSLVVLLDGFSDDSTSPKASLPPGWLAPTSAAPSRPALKATQGPGISGCVVAFFAATSTGLHVSVRVYARVCMCVYARVCMLCMCVFVCTRVCVL